jgi:septum formation protein
MKYNRIVLASASPRRREILSQVGVSFDIIPACGEEIITSNIPSEVVKELSLQKAKEVSLQCPKDTLVIGADTVVALDDKILGKPGNYDEAFSMLSALKNRSHSVYTGVALVLDGEVRSFVSETKVYVYDMTDEEIDEYIQTKDCFDKAGSYGIQGFFSQYVEKIEGDYFNVVGLPISLLIHEIKKMESE